MSSKALSSSAMPKPSPKLDPAFEKTAACVLATRHPGWAPTWVDRRDHEAGVIEWDGPLLDGWEPADAPH